MDSLPGTLRMHIEPPTAHFVAAGDFDVSVVPSMVTQLNDALTSGCREFRLDLARVTFLDAATIGVIVRLRHQVDELNGQLTIANPAPCVRRICQLTGLDSLLNGTTPRHETPVKLPLRLAIVDDYAVVVAGVAAILAREHIDVVETGANTPVISDVDVVLYDTFAQIQGTGIDLEDFVRDSGAKVVIYSWNLDPQLIAQAMAAGASGYLSKVLTGPQIVDALHRIVAGELVVLPGNAESSVGGAGDWPGRSAGLSPREAEVIALITQGMTNQAIADRMFVSINSVKVYIRTAYRKIGVERRPQAVLWGVQNGFQPDTLRTVDPALGPRAMP
jgi:two-component system, NarL family, response regulator LiaR